MNYPIARLCRMLKVSRAWFYRWRNPKGPSPRQIRHEKLVEQVTTAFKDAGEQAGRDPLTRLLNNDGVEVSAPTVGSIMVEHGLRAARTRAWKKTTVQDPQAKTAHIKNHTLDANGKRNFSSTAPGPRFPAMRGHYLFAYR